MMLLAIVVLAADCPWTARGLTSKEPRVLIEAPEHARESVIRALHVWAAAADFRFVVVTESPDLMIRTMQPGECGVSNMAGAFSTDDAVVIRDWDSPRLLSLLIHEVGHWLGLSHSESRASVMFAMIQEERFDDIGGEDMALLVARYGGAAEPSRWTVREPLAWGKCRYRGVGEPPPGAIGRGGSWSFVTGDLYRGGVVNGR
jgi:hypothetical protein